MTGQKGTSPQANPLKNAVLVDGGKRLSVFLPVKHKRRARVREVIVPQGLDPLASFGKTEHETLCLNLARAFRWKELLDDGTFGSVNDLAKHGGVDRAYVGRLLRLTLLAPDIVEAILEGREPEGLTLPDLLQPLPWLWEEQRGVLGVECFHVPHPS